jgi:hypothetical protein
MILDYLFEFLWEWLVRHFKLWRRHRLVMRVQNWPRASGKGLGAHARSSVVSHPIWAADITYNYVVNGEYYSGYVSLPADNEGTQKD